ncbi:MAG: YihA family ribosome biogenesis GTP-binding protein [Candidatus Glassbacteria bacterium]|nr:YihA family ribosome biogenesis GTP-binding protein [Candidatus Glassbacteria bacterium]
MTGETARITSIEPAGTFGPRDTVPPADLPQVAFTGRSNVGKSSLINRMLGRRKLAPISSTPGKTRKIHLFKINGQFYIVDLPGYGFAKLPVEVKQRWELMVKRYMAGNEALRGVVCLLDIRRDLTDIDRAMLLSLAEKGLPLMIALTKADKLKRARQNQAVDKLVRSLGGAVAREQILPTSSQSGQGVEELLENVFALICGDVLDQT